MVRELKERIVAKMESLVREFCELKTLLEKLPNQSRDKEPSQSPTTVAIKFVTILIMVLAIGISIGYVLQADGDAIADEMKSKPYNNPHSQRSFAGRYKLLMDDQSKAAKALDINQEVQVAEQLSYFLDKTNSENQHLTPRELKELLKTEGMKKRLELEQKYRPEKVEGLRKQWQLEP